MFLPGEVSLSGEFAEMLNKPKENAGRDFSCLFFTQTHMFIRFSFPALTGKKMSCGMF